MQTKSSNAPAAVPDELVRYVGSTTVPRFQDVCDIKTYRLDQIMAVVVDAFGLEDVLSVLEDSAREHSYEGIADLLKTAQQIIESEEEDVRD